MSIDDRSAALELDARTADQAVMFQNRVTKNIKRLRRWVAAQGISCYRIYDRDIPELPFAVDWYDGRLHVAEYSRRSTASMSAGAHREWTDALIGGLGRALNVDPSRVFLKRREQQRGTAQYERVAKQGARAEVVEGDLRFVVNLSDYLDTGLFLDHRSTRSMVRDASRDKTVLNLFGYTGTFSVYAADGGARETVTVDMSRTYLDWARDNLALNGLGGSRSQHRLVRDEALTFLEAQASRGARYDLVVADPPTFSNSKRMVVHFDVQRDHVRLIDLVLDVLAPGGVIYFSTNFRKFRLDEALTRRTEVEDVTEATIPRDFRDRRVHRCFTIRRKRRRVV